MANSIGFYSISYGQDLTVSEIESIFTALAELDDEAEIKEAIAKIEAQERGENLENQGTFAMAALREEVEKIESVYREQDKIAKAKAKAEEEAETECKICFEAPCNALAVPCLHSEFCVKCLDIILTSNNRTCPVCRSPLEGKIIKTLKSK